MFLLTVTVNGKWFSSVWFGSSVMSDFLPPHGLQHARPPCPSPTPRVYSNSCPLSWRCHPAISFSVTSFSSYSQSFPIRVLSNESALIGASASASVLPMNIQGWFPLGLTGLISFVQGTLKSIFHYHSLRASVLWCSAFFIVQLSHSYITTGKTIV